MPDFCKKKYYSEYSVCFSDSIRFRSGTGNEHRLSWRKYPG